MYELTEELRKAILTYLASCPYGQVAQLVKGLAQCKPIEEKGEPDAHD